MELVEQKQHLQSKKIELTTLLEKSNQAYQINISLVDFENPLCPYKACLDTLKKHKEITLQYLEQFDQMITELDILIEVEESINKFNSDFDNLVAIVESSMVK
ncbi:hypothetical protein PVK64_17885 [Aliivibrio sp. S4TY2]|uniref:hypothetical protein n=1 Tax=unclassified Aliivibrio TaxID=2645654 RepID=UPI002377E3AB|nr:MULTISPECIES: hypothetical protein [unclassified Aliivibrio]MDD9158037.1 hypothetical protein [Aliivibrio sp. S4TY2]MDD9161920.1 hypothetical protein [Aliivibrio sp. S4TY1]MDD9166034.1 hypothetical protein [Aliivibrio sp. S4MY2]MDD9170000.1 hypothetical protein [Aliivibrio sp. S4MY4]MDD9187051.1 hypothetical protein [Aliivibrio sp. S4MY3]